jgi:hypothetical protein
MLEHALWIRRFAAAACALALVACGGGGGGGGGDGGGTATFRVLSLDPENGATNVDLHSPVEVTFSLPVDLATIGGLPITVGIIGKGSVSGSTVPVADGTGTKLVWNPSEAMQGETNYVVFVSSGIRSTGGHALGGVTSFAFRTTGGVDLPQQTQLRPTLGMLNTGRRCHTATLLGNGRVLVTGGFEVGTFVSDRAEIYNPVTETFTALSDRMVQPRAQHTATRLLDGRVLIVGGVYEISSAQLNTTWSAEIFDPATNTFTAADDLGDPRHDHAALRLPDGRVLVTGGSMVIGSALLDYDDAEVFDPATGEWTYWPTLMTHSHATHGMVDLGDGRLFFGGGSEDDLRCEVMDVATGVFSPLAHIPGETARFGAAVETFSNGDAAVVGGDSNGSVLHFYRGVGLLVPTGSNTNRPRSYATATRISDERILVVGGVDFSAGSFVLSTVDLLVQGGAAGSSTYATPVRFPTGMANHTATTLADGRVLFCGGLNTSGGALERKGAYIFTP